MLSLLSLESSPLLLEDSDTSNCAYCKLVIGNILKNSNGNKCDQCNVMIHPNFTAYHKCGYPNCPICKNPITNSQYWRHIRSHPGHENDSPPPPRKTFENREYRGRYGSGSSSSSSNNNNNNNNNKNDSSNNINNTIQKLVTKGLIRVSNDNKLFVPNFKQAYRILNDYSIRGIGGKVDILFNKKVVGERSLPQAIEELHENAIYFLSSKRYQVKKLHYDPQLTKGPYYAELTPIPDDYPYYTKAIVDEWPSIIEVYEQKRVFEIEVKYCSLKIKKKVMGYTNVEIGQEVTQGRKVMFSEPIEFQFITKGLVFRAPRPIDIIKDANDQGYVEMSGYHASEHVIIEGSGMITGGASQDMGGVSLGSSGLIFIHDASIGGNGASKALYDRLDAAIRRALRILMECPCKNESGCPRCTYSYRCGNNNEYLHKIAAIEILNKAVLGHQTEIDIEIQSNRALV
jgi:DEAD/DEAH box helicase domain-containing protein